MKENIFKIMGWGIFIFFILLSIYTAILLTPGFNPAEIEMPSWAQSQTTSALIMITFFSLFLFAASAIEKPERYFTYFAPVIIFTILVMFMNGQLLLGTGL